MRHAILACAVFGTLAAEPIELRVSGTVLKEPGYVRTRAILQPHRENRWLTLAADSGEYFRSSAVSLDGARAARVHIVVFDNLPAGWYTISAVVERSGGDEFRSEAVVQVVGEEPLAASLFPGSQPPQE